MFLSNYVFYAFLLYFKLSFIFLLDLKNVSSLYEIHASATGSSSSNHVKTIVAGMVGGKVLLTMGTSESEGNNQLLMKEANANYGPNVDELSTQSEVFSASESIAKDRLNDSGEAHEKNNMPFIDFLGVGSISDCRL